MPHQIIPGVAVGALSAVFVLVAGCGSFHTAPSACIVAAEDAGLPDNMVQHLEAPEQLNHLERAALRQAIQDAGLARVCETTVGVVEPPRELVSVFPELPTAEKADVEPESVAGSVLSADPGRTRLPFAEGGAYGRCLDEVFLRSGEFGVEYWLSAAIWYCRDLEPVAEATSNATRCRLTAVQASELRYPEWHEVLHFWHATSLCNPVPARHTLTSGSGGSEDATPYGACLDSVYLTLTGSREVAIRDGELASGISAWMCREYLPDPPARHDTQCALAHLEKTQALYPEWPEDLHGWHAAMHCIPEWEPSAGSDDDAYGLCLTDVYAQVEAHGRKRVAIAVAAWRCRERVPDPPVGYKPRCLVDALTGEDGRFTYRDELATWEGIVTCYPFYRP